MNTDQKKLRKSGRRRRASGWTLLALGVLVAGVWVASRWWTFNYHTATWGTSIENGVVSIGVARNNFSPLGGADEERIEWNDEAGWEWSRGADAHAAQTRFAGIGLVWYEEWDFSKIKGPGTDIEVAGVGAVLWPLPFLLLTPAAFLLRSGILARRRALTGSCAKCGYSLVGLADGAACPECGKKNEPQIHADQRR